MHWAPETPRGRWALSLAGAAVGGTVAVAIAFASGVESGETFTDNLFMSLVGVAILASSAASVALGSVALTRDHDRSWLVLAGTTLGLLVTVLMLQQVAEGLGWLES